MVLASIDYELWRGQAQNGVNLAFQVKFDLEGQGQSPPKTIGTLTKLFCTFCPNLVVLAWTRRDLWRGQARGWRTHTQTDTHTDRQTQATTIPEGQNWPRVKTYNFVWFHGGCFLNVLWATQIARFMRPTWGPPGSCRPQMGPMNLAIRVYIQNNLAKICNARNHIYGENFKLKLCTCTQSMGDGLGLPQLQ